MISEKNFENDSKKYKKNLLTYSHTVDQEEKVADVPDFSYITLAGVSSVLRTPFP